MLRPRASEIDGMESPALRPRRAEVETLEKIPLHQLLLLSLSVVLTSPPRLDLLVLQTWLCTLPATLTGVAHAKKIQGSSPRQLESEQYSIVATSRGQERYAGKSSSQRAGCPDTLPSLPN
eukprot:4868123-Amphidinium_carterae.2